MSSPMRAALIVNPVTQDRPLNLNTAIAMIREAAGHGANLVLLGEMAFTGMLNNDDPAHDLPLGESVPGPLSDRLAQEASTLGIWLGFGLLERDDTRLYDTAVLLSPTGDVQLQYRRIQPQWHSRRADPAVYCQGTELPQVETEFGSLAFMICGDLWDDGLRARMRDLRPDWMLYLFARSFSDHARDQARWESEELPYYAQHVADIGVPTLATSYVCSEVFCEEAEAFGGAMVFDRAGAVAAMQPLDQPGILYWNAS